MRLLSIGGMLLAAVTGMACVPRYAAPEGAATARVRFEVSIPDWNDRDVEYGMTLRDGSTCSALGSVKPEKYTGALFFGDPERAKADFAASALALQIPGARPVNYGLIVKELRVAAGQPIVVVTKYKSTIDRVLKRRSVCSVETRFIPEKDADYVVYFAVHGDHCLTSADQLLTTDGVLKRKGATVPGSGCLAR